MWDDNNDIESSVTFTYRNYDSDGNQTGFIERTLYNNEAECLHDILETFQYFLLGMTFTYVDHVAAFSKDGEELSTTA